MDTFSSHNVFHAIVRASIESFLYPKRNILIHTREHTCVCSYIYGNCMHSVIHHPSPFLETTVDARGLQCLCGLPSTDHHTRSAYGECHAASGVFSV